MPAFAAFVPVDTFESRTLGPIGGQGSWLASSVTAAVVEADPDVTKPNNEVLHRVGTGGASHPLSLANGSSGTFFLRVRNAGGGTTNNDEVFGLSDVASPDLGGDFGVFEVQGAVFNSTLRFRDGAAAQDKTTLEPNTWYNIWMVIDNTADTWRMYLQGGTNFPTQTELTSTSVDADIDFRNGLAANALSSFLAKAGGGGGTTSVFYDDLYLDTAGANLLNPIVPEPASVTMLALAALAALGYRRR